MTNDANDTNDKYREANAKHRLAFVICHWSLVIPGFLLRLAPLGRYVTPDEPAWVYRSIRFADALAARDWAAVPSTGHPGVTTMWLGALGVAVRRLLNPAASVAHLDWIRRLAWLAPENGEAFRHLAFFLPWGRVATALLTTLGLVILYPLLARLFDRRVALLAVGLLALDPFLTGHSGLLHTDALLATFSLLALVTALNGVREPHRAAWWALAGLFTGLALLTKTPALVLLPLILLLVAICNLQSAIRNPPLVIGHWSLVISHWSLFIVHCSLFILLTVVTCIALYPALWADPAGTLRTLSAFAGRHVETVQRPIFFAGHMTHDPGLAFYPAVFLFRASPIVLLGLAIGLIQLRRMPTDRRFAFLALLAFAILLGAMMSLGAKKHDRYLLPAFPPLTLAAALGWEYLSRRVMGRRVNEHRGTSSTHFSFTHLLIPLAQLTLVLPFIAYPLTCFNPLVGGSWAAARVLPVDWGEGMGAAARWLNQLPDADELTVAASSVPSFAPLFAGHTVPLDRASLADYTVLSSNQPTNQPTDQLAHTAHLGFLDHAAVYTNTAPFEQADYLAAHVGPEDLILLDADAPLLRRYEGPATLLSVASLPDEVAVAAWLAEQVPGREFAWVVAVPGASPITAVHLRRRVDAVATPVNTSTVASATITRFAIRDSRFASTPLSYRAIFGGQLALVDGAVPEAAAWPDPMQVTLRWRACAASSASHRAVVTLRDGEGNVWSIAESPVLNGVTFPTSAWAADEWADATYALPLPPGIPPDRYTVEVSLYDGATGAGLGAAGPDGAFRGTQVPVGEVSVVASEDSPDLADLEVSQRLDLPAGPLTLLGLHPPPAPGFSGDRLSFALFWQADATPATDHRARLRLVGSAGEIALETVVLLSPYPTSRWRPGERLESRHDLHVLPDIPPDHYRLALNVLDAEGSPLWEMDRAVAEVEVLPRERSFELPEDIPHRLNLAFGEIVHLCGYGLTQAQAAPGGSLLLTLYWQAEGPTDRDYTLFVHLLGPDGLPHGQVDRSPGGGLAPTSSWAAGQVIVDEVVLPVAADAPPGTYHIAAGFYDASHGDRLPATDAAGQSLPSDQAILPVEITIAGGAQ